MADLYSNLPGVRVTARDDGRLSIVEPTSAQTESVLILGTATDGPKNLPVSISRLEDAQKLFGAAVGSDGDFTGASLLVAASEVFKGGCRDVRVMRITGEKATVTINDGANTPTDLLKVDAKYEGDVYNDVDIVITSTTLTVKAPAAKGGVETEFTISDSKSIKQLAKEINASTAVNQLIVVSAASATVESEDSDTLDAGTYSLSGGANQLLSTGTTADNDDLYDALYTAYKLLEDYDVDIVVPAAMYADSTLTANWANFAQLSAQHCYQSYQRGMERHAVVGIKPDLDVSLSNVASRVGDLKDMTNEYELLVFTEDGNGLPTAAVSAGNDTGDAIDIGGWVDIVTVPELVLIFPGAGLYSANGYGVVAGMTSALPVSSALTGKNVPGIRGVAFSLSPSQMNTLSGNRLVCFRSRQNGITVTDSLTAAKSTSDFTRRMTWRSVKQAVKMVRLQAEPFIGEPNSPPVRNALTTSIQAGLQHMKEIGDLNDFRFRVFAGRNDLLTGQLHVELELVPAFELRVVRINVALRPVL